ncbi:MAG: tetratricopeptide repeat protein [Desulfocurvibacter africanus]
MNTARLLAFLLCLLLVPAGASAARLPPEARQALYKAQLLLDANKPMEAADELQGYTSSSAETPPAEVYLMLGVVHHKAGDRSKALTAFLRGHEKYPNNAPLCLNSAVALHEQGQYLPAGGLFERLHAIGASPDPQSLYHAGAAYYMGQDFASAARVMDRLLSLPGTPKKDWTRLAVHSFIAAGDIKRAEAMLLKHLQTAPDDATYWELLGKLNLDREKYAKATAALEVCYRLKEPSRQELERLADLYAYMQAPLRAALTLKRAYGPNADERQTLRMAALYAQAGRIDTAMRELERSALGGSPELLLEKGKLLFQARRFAEAVSALEVCLHAAPRNADARLYRALCAWELKDWPTARLEFRRVAESKSHQAQARGALAALENLESSRREAEGQK